MVIFGASGDLTKRKLLPALYNLAAVNLLPRQFAIVGFAYQEGTTESFREQLVTRLFQRQDFSVFDAVVGVTAGADDRAVGVHDNGTDAGIGRS